MYTKKDLLENEKMNNIIKANIIKTRENNRQRAIKESKKVKRENIRFAIEGIVLSACFLGTMLFVAFIEML